ncbi:transposase [Pelagicoccus sp. NFK12]|uniref:Transposase n=1 Tax=Pelagicoccus enzymogenes TaxID=2773457 RepID=A0A927F632_9BACT|nr:transposase [Pelagicoccus enzymogenes]
MESRLRRPSHVVPSWVSQGAVFHIRIRTDKRWARSLVNEALGKAIFDSVAFYQRRLVWNCRLLLLMPDHLHALISFNPSKETSKVVGAWKHFHVTHSSIQWQEGYFDHRIRNDDSLDEKAHYIRRNPVVLGLCDTPEDWPWVWDGGVWV